MEEEKKSQKTITKTPINEDYNKFDVFGSVFVLPVRYEVTKPLGSGAYGCVAEADDLKKGTKVAIK